MPEGSNIDSVIDDLLELGKIQVNGGTKIQAYVSSKQGDHIGDKYGLVKDVYGVSDKVLDELGITALKEKKRALPTDTITIANTIDGAKNVGTDTIGVVASPFVQSLNGYVAQTLQTMLASLNGNSIEESISNYNAFAKDLADKVGSAKKPEGITDFNGLVTFVNQIFQTDVVRYINQKQEYGVATPSPGALN